MSFHLLILRLQKTTVAVSESLKSLAGYPLQFIEANFITSGNYDLCSVGSFTFLKKIL
jgi:hypothetical protein